MKNLFHISSSFHSLPFFFYSLSSTFSNLTKKKMRSIFLIAFLLLNVKMVFLFNPPCKPYDFDLTGKVGKKRKKEEMALQKYWLDIIEYSALLIVFFEMKAIVTGSNVGLGLYSAKALSGI